MEDLGGEKACNEAISAGVYTVATLREAASRLEKGGLKVQRLSFFCHIVLGSWIESTRKLDGRVEQINGHPAIDLTAKPSPMHDRTD